MRRICMPVRYHVRFVRISQPADAAWASTQRDAPRVHTQLPVAVACVAGWIVSAGRTASAPATSSRRGSV